MTVHIREPDRLRPSSTFTKNAVLSLLWYDTVKCAFFIVITADGWFKPLLHSLFKARLLRGYSALSFCIKKYKDRTEDHSCFRQTNHLYRKGEAKESSRKWRRMRAEQRKTGWAVKLSVWQKMCSLCYSLSVNKGTVKLPRVVSQLLE